jgi:hypothetical protein
MSIVTPSISQLSKLENLFISMLITQLKINESVNELSLLNMIISRASIDIFYAKTLGNYLGTGEKSSYNRLVAGFDPVPSDALHKALIQLLNEPAAERPTNSIYANFEEAVSESRVISINGSVFSVITYSKEEGVLYYSDDAKEYSITMTQLKAAGASIRLLSFTAYSAQ